MRRVVDRDDTDVNLFPDVASHRAGPGQGEHDRKHAQTPAAHRTMIPQRPGCAGKAAQAEAEAGASSAAACLRVFRFAVAVTTRFLPFRFAS